MHTTHSPDFFPVFGSLNRGTQGTYSAHTAPLVISVAAVLSVCSRQSAKFDAVLQLVIRWPAWSAGPRERHWHRRTL